MFDLTERNPDHHHIALVISSDDQITCHSFIGTHSSAELQPVNTRLISYTHKRLRLH